MMRDAGAAEVHMRIASPPTRHSAAIYGVDTPERAKLLAHKQERRPSMTRRTFTPTASPLCQLTGSTRRLANRCRADIRPSHCDACFTGDYPTTLTDQDDSRDSVDQFALLAERVV